MLLMLDQSGKLSNYQKTPMDVKFQSIIMLILPKMMKMRMSLCFMELSHGNSQKEKCQKLIAKNPLECAYQSKNQKRKMHGRVLTFSLNLTNKRTHGAQDISTKTLIQMLETGAITLNQVFNKMLLQLTLDGKLLPNTGMFKTIDF